MLAWLDLTGCALSLRPLHWFQYVSCPNFSQRNGTSKVLQVWYTICLDNSSANWNCLFSRNYPSDQLNSSHRLSLLQETLHLRGLVYLFFCARWHYHFSFFFIFFLPVIYWCSYKGIFRIFFPKFLRWGFSSLYQSVFTNLILNVFWNWGDIILSRLSVWFYLVTNDRYFCLINTTRLKGRNFIIRLSIFLLRHCFVKISQISNFCHI